MFPLKQADVPAGITQAKNVIGLWRLRGIKGLEACGAVVDSRGSPLSELVAVVIPTQQTAVEPNEAIKARLLLEGVGLEAAQAGVRKGVTGVILD